MYPRLEIREGEATHSPEMLAACQKLHEATLLRRKYLVGLHHQPMRDGQVSSAGTGGAVPASFRLEHGVFRLVNEAGALCDEILDAKEFLRDYTRVLEIVNDGPVKTLSYERMKLLELKYQMHTGLNSALEQEATTEDIRDFHNVYKVDTHVHLAAAMTASQLLRFIKEKLVAEKDTVVNVKRDADGNVVLEENLAQVFQRLNIRPEHLTTDSLDVHGDNTFQRFDNFNSKYNPFGFAELRDIFLKSSNAIQGRYFAELTQELLRERGPCLASEYRVSIYGRSPREWVELAEWVGKYRLQSKTNRWIVQVPRIFNVWNKHAGVACFEAMISNIFLPLFQASLDPAAHPTLSAFLDDVSGYDSVDDESKPEPSVDTWPHPEDWRHPENPAYAYYQYYIWANLAGLNKLRASRGLSTFNARPHCGESGSVDHLAAAFLVASHINHGINLHYSMPLQYLYYLTQIGLAVSPLSNNSLFLDYRKNPFKLFFHRGLFVSLSTDDPLQFHFTQDPLIEEYAIASIHWKFNSIDLSELARNSVLMSGFTHRTKTRWVGPSYFQEGLDGNDISFTNVPNIRVSYRHETLTSERAFLLRSVSPSLALSSSSPSSPSPSSSPLVTSSTSSLASSPITRAESPVLARWTSLEISHPADVPINISQEGIRAVYLLQKAKLLRRKYVLTNHPAHPDLASETLPASADAEPLNYVFDGGIFRVSREQLRKARLLPDSPIAALSTGQLNRDIIYASLSSLDAGLVGDDTHIVKRSICYQHIISFEEFLQDYQTIVEIAEDGPSRTWCDQRLSLLDNQYRFHLLMNKSGEKAQVKRNHSDFYQAHKVDTHVHLSSAPHPEQLLVFMKKALEDHASEPVTLSGGGPPETLSSIFKRLHIPVEHLTIDSLGMSNLDGAVGRFDTFKELHNPFGSAQMRELFLKHDNDMDGRFFGELIQSVMDISARTPQCHTEYRVSIAGRYPAEWHVLAAWAQAFNLVRPGQNTWLIQVPRNYHLLKAAGSVGSFGQMLQNIFQPLFDVTLNPSSDPVLHQFLSNVSGFDSVDDESHCDVFPSPPIVPDKWTHQDNPPYVYYLYYMWANVTSLNNLRRACNLTVFDFRPHSGAAGDWRHLAGSFLLSQGISHGLLLNDRPVLQYLWYLMQIPIYCSPIAENGLYLSLENHPFIDYFRRGLSVSLCTDNPLQHHFTEEPLIEEYAIVAQLHALSPIDMTEIAVNSVLHSGFSDALKRQWMGANFRTGNDPLFTNLPPIRHSFRQFVYRNEKAFISICMRYYTEHGALRRDLPVLSNVLDTIFNHTPATPDPDSSVLRSSQGSNNSSGHKSLKSYFRGIATKVARSRLRGSINNSS
ncbi:MAG: hypothetical protein Q8P67_22860 [archaeon]|nr:hypothetical protein [archaeon]